MKRARQIPPRIALLEQRRLDAATLFEQGARTVEVARTFQVAWRTAFKWRQAYIKHGAAGLRSRGRPGREPLLDSAQVRRLRAILRTRAGSHGFPDDAWTLKRIHEVAQRVFGMTCSRVSIWRLVRHSLAATGADGADQAHCSESPDQPPCTPPDRGRP